MVTKPSAAPNNWTEGLESRAERYLAGRNLRRKASRSRHGKWTHARNRPDPISILEESNKLRHANLVPIRYGRMSTSPFAFFRGSAEIMARDLSDTPASGVKAQLCGDAHLSNFGVYASPERRLVFDINDFDETIAGPWEWDVKRLATSILLAGRGNGFPPKKTREAVMRCLGSYRVNMQQFSLMHHLDVWYFRLDLEEILGRLSHQPGNKGVKKILKRAMTRASKRTRIQTFPKLAESVNGKYRIKDDPPLIFHYDTQFGGQDILDTQDWRAFVLEYLATLPDEKRMVIERYRTVDMAQKVVGVGSVGTACAIVLLLGGAEGDDPLFMQIKEAQASALEPYVDASPYSNHGQRVVSGQFMMQAASDAFLGWSKFKGRDFFFRQLHDMKLSAEIDTMNPAVFGMYAELCAAALARAHARTSDPAMISGYLGNKDIFDQAIADFAELYADQTEGDFAALNTAIKEGRVKARTGV